MKESTHTVGSHSDDRGGASDNPCYCDQKPLFSYPMLKNHIHNTLDISKEDIRSMVEQAIERVVERRVDVLLEGKINLDRLVDDTIKRKITEKNWFWGESNEKLDDYIKKEVVRKLIDGVKLEVAIKQPVRRKK